VGGAPEELPGKDPLVTMQTTYFVPVGPPRSEWPEPPVAQPRPLEAAEPAPVMVATRSFAVPAGHAIVMVARGDRFRETHHLVRL
jgi:hypothetical protein